MGVKWMTREHKGGETSVLFEEDTGKIVASCERDTGCWVWEALYQDGGMYDGNSEYISLEQAQIAIENKYHRITGERVNKPPKVARDDHNINVPPAWQNVAQAAHGAIWQNPVVRAAGPGRAVVINNEEDI